MPTDIFVSLSHVIACYYLGLYIYQCVKASKQSSITRMQTIIATVGLVLGIFQDVKITHFEPVYVQ